MEAWKEIAIKKPNFTLVIFKPLTKVKTWKDILMIPLAPIACNMVQVGDQRFLALSLSSIKRAHIGNMAPIASNMVQVRDQRFLALGASSIKRAHVGNMAPIASNMVQVGDQRFPTLSASSIKRAHAGNILRPLGGASF
ncbi:hypothetical protein ACH5RR_015645 [Cinchona calisaya]|uniref:Uncharacterized protein n=1 Tax=Cinchona calisaya TaxID=153742 RepID=A0ABD2ZTP1_9GENT